MMYLLIIWRNLCQRRLQSLLSLSVVAGSIAVAIFVMLLSAGIHQGLIRAAQPFDLIVGAKGSPNQLVLNTVFLQDSPIGNVRRGLLEEIERNPLVASAIPMGFGDNYRGCRLIGTSAEIFSHRIGAGAPEWLQLREGTRFAKSFEAVIGAKVAAQTGLRIGDTFATSHGVVAGAGDAHPEKFTVTGILEELGGPYDGSILVSLESIWVSHGAPQKQAGEDSRLQDSASKGITAILVKPKGYAEAIRLYQEFQQSQEAQLVFPAQVVVGLFAILGEGEKIFQMIAWAVFAMAILMVSVSLYWSGLSRARDHAILRAIGAGRRDLFFLSFGEGALLITVSAAIGTALGHGIFYGIAGMLQRRTALAMDGSFTLAEAGMIAVILAAGMIAALLPAGRIAKRDVADEL